MKNIVIILSGGIGGRFGGKIPKQFILINKIPLFIHAIKKFENYQIILVILEDYKELAIKHIKLNNCSPNITIVSAGKTRKDSCYAALKYIHDNISDCENVIITEGVRPCIKSETISKCIKQLETYNALITVTKSINTSCISKNKEILDTILDRTFQYDLLMPECFKFKKLYDAYQKIDKDTTSIVEIYKHAYPYDKIGLIPISIWEGLKLTYPEDYEIMKFLLKEK